MRADKKVATTIPDNIMVSRLRPPASRENVTTKKRAIMAPKKLKSGTRPSPLSQTGIVSTAPPIKMTIVAPKAAPDATPMVNGSANGLISTP